MTTPVFGFMSDAKEAVTEFAHNCLLVAGAFLVGYILGGVIGWALGKWVLRQKSPDTLKKVGRPVGGVILALIVALMVFTGRGRPFGPGGEGKGSPDSAGKGGPPASDQEPKVDPNVTPPKADFKPADLVIRVTVLAGAAVVGEKKFYLMDDDRSPKTLSELKDAIASRRSSAKGKAVLAVLFPSDPNLAPPRNDPRVTDVTRWATEEAGLDVIFPASK